MRSLRRRKTRIPKFTVLFHFYQEFFPKIYINTFFNVFSDGTVVGSIVPTVWTGTSSDGTIGSLGLGSGSVVGGYPVITTSRWVSTGFFASHFYLPMYAVSDVLTVSDAPIPEPSTLLLFAVALVSVIVIGYRRKRTK